MKKLIVLLKPYIVIKFGGAITTGYQLCNWLEEAV